ANGIFEPLEVALNRAWGIAKNRSFVKNQIISLALIFACGTLGLASTVLTGLNAGAFDKGPSLWIAFVIFKVAAVYVTILMLFLVYWLLPNARVSWRLVLPPAIFAGLALEAMKYVNILTWPLWRRKLQHEYGPFHYSVTILMWSFLGAMIILAGAEWAARRGAFVRTTEIEASEETTAEQS
ncbi:MAG: YihY/virulence factor BrkB family protein, partial [Bryobacteraceae bacterium]